MGTCASAVDLDVSVPAALVCAGPDVMVFPSEDLSVKALSECRAEDWIDRKPNRIEMLIHSTAMETPEAPGARVMMEPDGQA